MLHTFARLKSVCFSFWTPYLSYFYSPKKAEWLKHTNKWFWQLTFLTRRKLKDKFRSASVFVQFTVIRIFLWFLSPRRDSTWVITFLTDRSLEIERMTTVCHLLKTTMTIRSQSRSFLSHRKKEAISLLMLVLTHSLNSLDLGQVSYLCTSLSPVKWG